MRKFYIKDYNFKCPSCGVHINTKSASIGDEIDCKSCSDRIKILSISNPPYVNIVEKIKQKPITINKNYFILIPSVFIALTTFIIIYFSSAEVDICKCLTEAGNSEYMLKNGDACRDAISKELGVDNWETVNFSKNANLSAKFDALANRCK